MSTTPITPTTGPPKLINLYNLRQVATCRPCFICMKSTDQCLANDAVTDFMYVCKSHVLDPGFAKPAPSSSSSNTSTPPPTSSPTVPPSAVPQSEIDKVKKEYEEKQQRKLKAASSSTDSTTTTTTPSSTAGKAFSVLKSSASAITSLASTTQTTLFPPPTPVIPSPSELLRQEASRSRTFVLNRSYFQMRCDLKRKEWERKDAKEREKEMPMFPKAPKGGFPTVPTTKIG